MKLLFVSRLDRAARAVNTIAKYVQVGRSLGHEVAVFGEQSSVFPELPHSLDITAFDYALLVVYETWDFPDLPYLARLLDGMPRERRVIIDCCGRYNDTIRVEHDFNHLEKMDGHQGWEWVEGFQAVADRILQPTLTPLRSDAESFLFHGYDDDGLRPRADLKSPSAETASATGGRKPYGVVYVGNNWQRWTQVRAFLEAIEPIRTELGGICLAGCDWDSRPEWAIQLGMQGADLDRALLDRLEVETRPAIPFDQVEELLGQARFAPVFHRPLFNHLGLVTNRTFQTFSADTIPLLMLPPDLVEAIYGADARLLAPDHDVASRLGDMMRRPDVYREAVSRTRAHLAQHHSYQRRFEQLLGILEH